MLKNVFCARGGKTVRHPTYSELKSKELELKFKKKDLQRTRARNRKQAMSAGRTDTKGRSFLNQLLG